MEVGTKEVFKSLYFQVFSSRNYTKKGSQVGKANGLSLLLDAETFDYSFPLQVHILLLRQKKKRFTLENDLQRCFQWNDLIPLLGMGMGKNYVI